ncbi:MAG TPA: helix-turn-helix transcriptional regulator [Trebonia sp.]
MASSGSPTVRRRRLAAELRRLRGNRTGSEVSRGVGWSTTKISRAESGRETLPPSEVEKLIDFYGVTEPLRARLLGLAEDATKHGWWEDYSDSLTPDYMEFIGLEDEAAAVFQWQSDVIPGLLQTEDYAWQLDAAYRRISPTIPPTVRDRLLRVRSIRQERLTSEPALQLAVVMDEACLLRGVGSRDVMRAQLAKLAEAAESPNVELRVLPLHKNTGLVAASFAIISFSSRGTPEAESLGDVVTTESLNTEVYVGGEADTHFYRVFFEALLETALPADESRDLIVTTARETWA